MPSKEIRIPWVTVQMESAGNPPPPDIIQQQDEWMDTEGFTSCAFMFQCPKMSDDITLYFETAMRPEGPWRNVGTIESSGLPTADDEYAAMKYMTSAADAVDANRFDRYIRWRLSATGGDPHICFRFAGVFRA